MGIRPSSYLRHSYSSFRVAVLGYEDIHLYMVWRCVMPKLYKWVRSLIAVAMAYMY